MTRVEGGVAPAGDLGRHLALVRRLVRQHRLADDVADGEDVRHVGAHLLVDGMKPRSSTATPAFSAAMSLPFGLRPTETSTLSKVSLAGAPPPSKCTSRPLALASTFVTFEVDLLVALLDALHERRDDVAVGAGDDLVHQLDHGHLGAERMVDGRHLQADDAAADDEQALGMPSISSAPVESMTRGSSCGMNGSMTGSEPAAMIAWSNETSVRAPPFSTSSWLRRRTGRRP